MYVNNGEEFRNLYNNIAKCATIYDNSSRIQRLCTSSIDHFNFQVISSIKKRDTPCLTLVIIQQLVALQ